VSPEVGARVGDTRVFVVGIGVFVGGIWVFVRIGVSVQTFPPDCIVGEGVINKLHKKNFVFVGVKVAVGVSGGVLEGKGVGDDLLGVGVAFP
jgi:hypothetical protein